ncbi:hypothetical protein L6R53_16800 [Myxococcota bacterium]|nr:hypothetical protein [Myxococcota bacterium]
MRLDLLDLPTLPRSARLALDGLAVLAVLGVAWWLWPVTRMPADVDLGQVPWWGGARDLMLEGPDAGEWARNMRLLSEGRWDELDHHRLPSWMVMVAALMELEPDVVRAGHITNRALFVVLGLATWTLGRLGGGRVVGLLAAAMAMATTHVMSATERFGVDMSVSAMIPAVMAAAALATRSWGLGVVAGGLAGLAAGLHYTTPPYLVPPLLLLLGGATAPLWTRSGVLRRLGAVALYLAGAALVVRGLLVIYPVPSPHVFLEDLANGISPGAPGQGARTLQASLAEVRAGLPAHAVAATSAAVDRVRIQGLPWAAMVALPWLGVLGLGLGTSRAGQGSPWRALLARTDTWTGIALLCCLAPLPVLFGVGAPERYGNNLLGVVAVLAARGVGSLVALVDTTLRFAWPRWPRGPLALVVGLPLVGLVLAPRQHQRQTPPPLPQEVGTMLLGNALAAHFPAGTGVASPIREALVVANLSFCPQRVCPTQATDEAFARCVRVLAQECEGEGPIGYVWTSAEHFYDPNSKRHEMDDWVAARFPAVSEVVYGDFSARIHLIDRPVVGEDEDPLAGEPVPGQRPDGSVPPPPDLAPGAGPGTGR